MWITSPAFWVSVAGVITAITALVRVVQHQNGPQHQSPAPAASTGESSSPEKAGS